MESEVATLRHENFQMKFTKTHRKQDYVWHSIKNFEPYITWLALKSVNQCSRILFLYTTTDCTHSLNCVGVTCFIFLPSAHAILFIWPQLALQFKNLSFTTRRRFALLRLLREIKKNSKKKFKIIFFSDYAAEEKI